MSPLNIAIVVAVVALVALLLKMRHDRRMREDGADDAPSSQWASFAGGAPAVADVAVEAPRGAAITPAGAAWVVGAGDGTAAVQPGGFVADPGWPLPAGAGWPQAVPAVAAEAPAGAAAPVAASGPSPWPAGARAPEAARAQDPAMPDGAWTVPAGADADANAVAPRTAAPLVVPGGLPEAGPAAQAPEPLWTDAPAVAGPPAWDPAPGASQPTLALAEQAAAVLAPPVAAPSLDLGSPAPWPATDPAGPETGAPEQDVAAVAWWDAVDPVAEAGTDVDVDVDVAAAPEAVRGRFALGGHAVMPGQPAVSGVSFPRRPESVPGRWCMAPAADAPRGTLVLELEAAENCLPESLTVLDGHGVGPSADGFVVSVLAQDMGPFLAAGTFSIVPAGDDR